MVSFPTAKNTKTIKTSWFQWNAGVSIDFADTETRKITFNQKKLRENQEKPRTKKNQVNFKISFNLKMKGCATCDAPMPFIFIKEDFTSN